MVTEQQMRVASAGIDKLEEPVYDHRTRIKERSQPLQKYNDNKPISVFWEIGGVKVHCLIDSGCEGIMISPNFIRVANVKPFPLDKLFGIQLAVMGSKSVINYGANSTVKYNEIESKEYFDIVNIDYYDAILGTPFLRKHEVIIGFMNNCLKIKDNIIHNQANEYKVGEGNPQKNKKNVSMKALKQEPKIPQEDSNWLSKKSHPERGDEKDSENCLTQKSVGLKKELSKYTCSDIPQLWGDHCKIQQFIRATYVEVTTNCEVSHKIPVIDESKQLNHRLPKCPKAFCSELTQKIKWYTTTGWWVPAAGKTGNAYAVHTKEKQYAMHHIWSATAEQKYMERCDTFPRSRCNMSWYSMI